MEKENHRANRANCSPIRNQNERAELKEQCDEKGIREEKHFRTGTIQGKEIKCEEVKCDDEELCAPCANAIFGRCAICHQTLRNVNSSINENVPCSIGHALCQRCIQHLKVQTDRGCVLCHATYQLSSTNLLRDSNATLSSTHARSKRTPNTRQQSEYYCSRNRQQLHKSLNENYSSLVSNGEGNAEEYDPDDVAEIPDYEQIRNRCNLQEEQMRDNGKQRQQLSCCNSLFKRRNGDGYVCETKINGQITAEYSRRPIRCPRIDCAINVAFSALTHHFIFDHPEVPILNVEPGIKSTLIVSFDALAPNTSRCLALLLVSGKLSDPVARLFNGSQINPKYRNRLPLPVLVARLQCTDQYISNDKIIKQKNFQTKDIIIAWVAGLDIGNTTEKLLCSIQAVDKFDNEGLRSLTYTGPVNSLRATQCPRDIFSTGDCIVLHKGLLSRITSDCATLNVNVTVH